MGFYCLLAENTLLARRLLIHARHGIAMPMGTDSPSQLAMRRRLRVGNPLCTCKTIAKVVPSCLRPQPVFLRDNALMLRTFNEMSAGLRLPPPYQHHGEALQAKTRRVGDSLLRYWGF